MKNLLIVVDMQKDFVTGSLGSKEAVAIVDAVVQKVQGFDGEVIFTRDTHFENYMETQEGKYLPVIHCVKDTDGWALISELEKIRVEKDCKCYDKPTFGSTELAKYLVKENEKETIEAIELCGLCTDICVISNALLLKATFTEVPIAVDASCCAGVTPESHGNALLAMKMCQVTVYND